MRPFLTKFFSLLGFVVFASLLFADVAEATHFRYGHITWTQTGTSRQAQFTITAAFRRSSYTITNGGILNGLQSGVDGFPVVGSIITEGQGQTSLFFGDGNQTGQLTFKVTSIDPSNDVLLGVAINPSNQAPFILHTYPGFGPYTAEISDCCRIEGLAINAEGYYRVLTIVDFRFPNSSPVSSMPAMINLFAGAPATFQVPATDPNGNTKLVFRLATSAEAANAALGTFIQPSGLTINSSTGVVTWNTPNIIGGLFACQIVIEDRDATTNALKTQVAVDFIIKLVQRGTNTPPYYVSPTPAAGTTFSVNIGQPISFDVRATDNGTVVLNTGGLPPGATMSPLLPVSSTTTGGLVSSVFSWTPADGGSYVVTFTITDNLGAQVLRSFSINVSVPSANLVLSKTPSSPTVLVGSTFDYALTVTNDGPEPTTNIYIVDNLPPGLTFVSASAPGGSVGGSGNNRTISFPSLNVGQSATATIVATLNAAVPVGTVVSNIASVTSFKLDPIPEDNSAKADITAAGCPSNLTIGGSVPNFCQEDQQPINLDVDGTNLAGAAISWSLVGPTPNVNLGTGQTLSTTLSGLAPGNYAINVNVLAPDCHPVSLAANFIVHASPTVTINGPAEVFQNENTMLTANVSTGLPPFNFSWSNGGTTTSISPNTGTLGTSTYSVTVTDAHGCSATATASLLVKAIPVPRFAYAATAGHICLPPFMVQNPSQTHYWWAKAAGTGNLEIDFAAVSVNPTETGTATIRVYDPSNALVTTATLTHPASGETVAPPIIIPSPVAGSVYRIEVNVAPSPTPPAMAARHYRIELEGAEQLGTNSPLQSQAESESVRWGVNVLPGEPLDVTVQGGPEAPATTGSFEVRNPSGALVTTSPLGTPLNIPSAAAGMWTVTVTGLDHHVIVDKTSGADRGLYLGAFSDVLPPQIFVPGSISLSTGPSATTCGLIISDEQLGSTTAKDNCEVHITRSGVPAGNVFPVGTTTITYTATDGAGNSVSLTQMVTVIDNTPPTITAPADVFAATGAGATTCSAVVLDALLGSPTAADNCSVTVTRTGVPPGNEFPVGTTIVTYKATDPSGNSVSVTQKVTVRDTTPPELVAPPALTLTTGPGATVCGVAFNVPRPLTTDNCPDLTVSVSGVPSGSLFPVGTTTITFTAKDAAGNATSASQTITVIDDTPPVITVAGANPLIIECGAQFTDPGATATDNCALSSPPSVSGNNFDTHTAGTYIVTYTATDVNGNTASATRTVKVQDTAPPVLTVPADVIVYTGTDATSCGAVVTEAQLGTATVTDNCPVTLSRSTLPSGNIFSVGTTIVTYTAIDEGGNTVTGTQNVIVRDNTPPKISGCSQNISVVIASNQTGSGVTWTAPTASDNCSVTLTSNHAPGATFPPGITTVTYTATDPAGNTATCSFTVLVTVNNPPNCTATPSIAQLWPPNHKMVNITIQGVTDPDGDPVTITITGITQDEPLNTLGDGDTSPDGAIVGTTIAQVRAERSGTPKVPGNGRVYRISFTASDGRGGECQGNVAVCVPHDQGNRSVCKDDGQRYNSITGEIITSPSISGAYAGESLAEEMPAAIPTTFGLLNAYPNPFNPTTTIQYDLPEDSHVRIAVFDLLGREIALLVDGHRNAGRYSATFDATGLQSGMYLYRMETPQFRQVKRFILLK